VTHDPNNFPDPDSLIPERWLGENKEAISQLHASQSFSLGPRGCLGKKYVPTFPTLSLFILTNVNSLASLQMRLILGKLIWNFDIEYEEGSQSGFHYKTPKTCQHGSSGINQLSMSSLHRLPEIKRSVEESLVSRLLDVK
jgi:hypothetical protein